MIAHVKPFIYIRAVLMAWVACLLVGCDATIHEYPNESLIEQDFVLNLDFNLALTDYVTIDQTANTRAALSITQQALQPHKVRYVVNVYKANADGEFNRVPAHQFVFYTNTLSEKLQPLHLKLTPGNYRFITWADYVANDGTQSGYYDASDFQEIKMLHDANGRYQGNTIWRDAFIGQVDAEVQPMQSGNATIEMERPLAKYRFITTDLDEFIENALQREQAKAAEKAQQAAAQGNALALATDSTRTTANAKADTKADTRSIDLTQYHIMMTYPMFVPCSFNMFTNRPADSWAAQQYEGRIEQLSNTEAELGFDYVFVNGAEAQVTVGLALYDADGQLISSIDPITLPLKRSRLTTVRGKFLTSHASGAIGINPSFDGEYNIEIK